MYRRRAFNKRRVYRRRSYRRSSAMTARAPRVTMIRGVGLGRSMFTQFTARYADTLTVGTSGQADWDGYRLNGLVPPTVSAGTSRPRYFNQLVSNSLFAKYIVYKVDVEVVFHAENASNDTQGIVWARTETSAPTAFSPSAVFNNGELPYFNTLQLQGKDSGGNASTRRFKATYKPKNLFGVKAGDIFSEVDYHGSAAGNPAEQALLWVGAAAEPTGSAAGDVVQYEIYLKYHCKLYDNAFDVADVT